jgi:hypothetical protein
MLGEGMEEGEAEMMGALEKLMEAEALVLCSGAVGDVVALKEEKREGEGELEVALLGDAVAELLGVVTLMMVPVGEPVELSVASSAVPVAQPEALREWSPEGEVEADREGLGEVELLRAALRVKLEDTDVQAVMEGEGEEAPEAVACWLALSNEEVLGEMEADLEAAGDLEGVTEKDMEGEKEAEGDAVPPPLPKLGRGVVEKEKDDDFEAPGLRDALGEGVGPVLPVGLTVPEAPMAEGVKLDVGVVAFLFTVEVAGLLRETLAQAVPLRE